MSDAGAFDGDNWKAFEALLTGGDFLGRVVEWPGNREHPAAHLCLAHLHAATVYALFDDYSPELMAKVRGMFQSFEPGKVWFSFPGQPGEKPELTIIEGGKT